MSLKQRLMERILRRKQGEEDWIVPASLTGELKRDLVAAEIRQSIVPREIVLQGPAEALVLVAADRRLFRVDVCQDGTVRESFELSEPLSDQVGMVGILTWNFEIFSLGI